MLVSIAAERVRIPAAVLLVAVGAAFGSIWRVRPPFAFGPALFFVFRPPLIFEAAWSIDPDALRPAVTRVAILAVLGTVLSASVVAVVLVGDYSPPLDDRAVRDIAAHGQDSDFADESRGPRGGEHWERMRVLSSAAASASNFNAGETLP